MKIIEIINEETLNELFETTVPVEWKDTGDELIGRFEIDGVNFYISFEEFGEEWAVNYDIVRQPGEPMFTPTGMMGQSGKVVLGTVIEAIKTFIREKQPYSVSFSGSKANKLGPLYRALIKKLQPELQSLGYKSEVDDFLVNDNFTIVKETASSGGSSAGNVATVVGGLGAGFDPNGDHGIYQKKKRKPAVIRR